MALFLEQRDTVSRELMDDPNCDPEELQNTYRQFNTLNSLISQWKRIYKREIRPHLDVKKTNTILDIGFGGGDIPLKFARWASNDNYNLKITAIDPDPRAYNFVQELEPSRNVNFLQCGVSDLDPVKQQYDFIISNHLIHHLTKDELLKMLSMAKKLSKKAVIFNDIERSNWAYFLFNILSRPVFRSSYITEDGLTSIRRSYTFSELAELIPPDWHLESLFPFRLLLKYYRA